METILVVDRIEGDWAVIEYSKAGTTFNIPLTLLPGKVSEGDMIRFCITLQENETYRRRMRLKKLLEDNMDD